MNDIWKDYFQNTKNKPPRPLLVKALSYVKNKNKCLDLGSGALNDSVYLISEGFKHVTALDKEPVAKEIADKLPNDKLTYTISSFEDFEFPENEFDLINAQYSLPFISPAKFNEVFGKIYKSLKTEGILAGQFFGNKDEWSNDGNMNFHTKEEVEHIISNFEVLELNEEEKDGPTAVGDIKHWHVFCFILRK